MKQNGEIEMYNNGPLPRYLKERAYFSANEFALSKSDALDYLQWCKANSYPVLGYEVWLPTNPGPTALLAGGNGNADDCYQMIFSDDFEEEQKKRGLSIEAVFNICVDAD